MLYGSATYTATVALLERKSFVAVESFSNLLFRSNPCQLCQPRPTSECMRGQNLSTFSNSRKTVPSSLRSVVSTDLVLRSHSPPEIRTPAFLFSKNVREERTVIAHKGLCDRQESKFIIDGLPSLGLHYVCSLITKSIIACLQLPR